MASRNRKADPRETAKTGGLKSSLPVPPVTTIRRVLLKSETITFRLSPEEKENMRTCASSVGMTVSEYLLRCHEAVARHLHT